MLARSALGSEKRPLQATYIHTFSKGSPSVNALSIEISSPGLAIRPTPSFLSTFFAALPADISNPTRKGSTSMTSKIVRLPAGKFDNEILLFVFKLLVVLLTPLLCFLIIGGSQLALWSID